MVAGSAVSWRCAILAHDQLRCGDLGLGVRHFKRIPIAPCLLSDKEVSVARRHAWTCASALASPALQLECAALTVLRQSWISALGAGGFSGWCVASRKIEQLTGQVHAHNRARTAAAQGRASQAAAGAARGGGAGRDRGRQVGPMRRQRTASTEALCQRPALHNVPIKYWNRRSLRPPRRARYSARRNRRGCGDRQIGLAFAAPASSQSRPLCRVYTSIARAACVALHATILQCTRSAPSFAFAHR